MEDSNDFGFNNDLLKKYLCITDMKIMFILLLQENCEFSYRVSQQVYFHACIDNATIYQIIINAVTLQMLRFDI